MEVPCSTGPRGGPKLRKRSILNDDSSAGDDSQSDADLDSGYGSADGDTDKTAGFYDDLLARLETEGPTRADHGTNTKRMIEEQEEKWNQFASTLL